MICPIRHKAKLALLIDRFGLRPWEIARLTDRQIEELYFHKRDKDGVILFPVEELPEVEETPDTLETALAKLEELRTVMKPADYDAAVREVKRLYDERSDTTH